MKSYSLLHSANTHKHQHGFAVENITSHVYELMFELGCYVQHLEDRFTAWFRAVEKFLTIVSHDKKLLALFCGIIVLSIAIVPMLVIITKLVVFQG